MTEAEWLACADPASMLVWLESVKPPGWDRKAILLGGAFVRRIWHLLPHPSFNRFVEVTERNVEEQAGADELAEARNVALDAMRPFRRQPATAEGRRYLDVVEAFLRGRASPEEVAIAREAASASFRNPSSPLVFPPHNWGSEAAGRAAIHCRRIHLCASCAVNCAGYSKSTNVDIDPAYHEAAQAEKAAQADLCREVFGNPFRPVHFDPPILTQTVTRLAQSAYDNRTLPSGHFDPARLAVLSDALEEAGCTGGAILSHLRSPGPHVRGCWALDLILGNQ